MKTVPYTNNGKEPVSICGRVVKPGETREVDARFVPATPAVNGTLEVLYFNLGDSARYFGDTEVPVGGYARLSANFFVDPNTAADQVQTELFRAFLDQNLKVIGASLEAFTDDELAQLEAMEKTAEGRNARDGLFKLLKEELATRMAERDFVPAEYSKHLQSLSDEDLDLELLQVGDDEGKLPLVQAALSDRKDAKAAQ